MVPDASSLNSEELADKAIAELQNKNYYKAISLLNLAIASNAGDEGAGFNPMLFAVRENDSLSYGQKQLENMLRDRPLMKRYLDSSDDVWRWAALKYGEKVLGCDVEWDFGRLITGLTAEHDFPTKGHPGRIRVKKPSFDPTIYDAAALNMKSAAAFEELWSCVVFELYNIQSADQFQRLSDQILDDKIDRDKFVKTMFFIETRAAQRTRKWYVDVFLPHAKNMIFRLIQANGTVRCGDR